MNTQKIFIYILSSSFIFLVTSCRSRGPEELFRLHIQDPVPASITNIVARESEGSGLAGSCATIRFNLSSQDCVKIIHEKGFNKIKEEREYIVDEFCSELDFKPYILFMKEGKNGLIKYILIVNTNYTKAYYRYIKI